MTAPPVVNYLWGHAIELALKAFLLQSGFTVKQTVALRHDLEKCLDNALRHGLQLPSDFDEEPLRVLNTLYASKQLNYIETGLKSFPVAGPLHAMAKTLLLAVIETIPNAPGLKYRKAGKTLS